MKHYAYFDKYGILHAVDTEETAKKYSGNGKFVVTEMVCDTGYVTENGKKMFVYSKEKEFYAGGNAGKVPKTPEEEFKKKYPETYALYEALCALDAE